MVKQGYKQTEVGIIPVDWQVKTIGELGYVTSGESPSRFTFDNGNTPYFKVDQLNNSTKYQEKTPYKIEYEHPVEKGSIIFPKRGAAIATNKVRMLKNPSFFDTNIMSITFTNKLAHSEFFYYYLVRKELWQIADTTSVPQINNKHILPLLCPFPSFVEQERIVEALSDVDAMISSLEKLIAKKKAVKQGVMQELLTAKKRLPGFSGKWVTINLSKKSKIKARIGWQGLTTNEYLDSGYSYLVTGTDFVNGKIDWDNCHYVAKDRFDQDKNIQIQNDDILITKDGSLGKTALVKGLNKPATLNSGVFVIRPIQESYDPTFVYYILSSFVFKDFLDHLSAGSTIIHLYQKDINKFEFLIPPTIKEQRAIASILSDMDNEIEALEQKLEKARQIKQGMMQQLLTGKIRLV